VGEAELGVSVPADGCLLACEAAREKAREHGMMSPREVPAELDRGNIVRWCHLKRSRNCTALISILSTPPDRMSSINSRKGEFGSSCVVERDSRKFSSSSGLVQTKMAVTTVVSVSPP
jgi:hypothetical protein